LVFDETPSAPTQSSATAAAATSALLCEGGMCLIGHASCPTDRSLILSLMKLHQHQVTTLLQPLLQLLQRSAREDSVSLGALLVPQILQ